MKEITNTTSSTLFLKEIAVYSPFHSQLMYFLGDPQSPASPRKNPAGYKYSSIEPASLRRSSRSSSVSSLASSRSFSILDIEDNENLRLLMDEINPSEMSERDQRNAMIVLNIFLSVMTVITMVTQTVVTPLYVDAMSGIEVKSDAFIAGFLTCMWIPVIFFAIHFCFSFGRSFKKIIKPPDQFLYVFVAGTLAGLSNILVALTSLSLRTPTYLQGILQQTLVPFTAVSRFLIIGKGNIAQTITRTTHSAGSNVHQITMFKGIALVFQVSAHGRCVAFLFFSLGYFSHWNQVFLG